MKIQSTRVYAEVSEAINNGYKVVSAQGSSRSSKTYNILIFLIAYVLKHKGTALSIVRKTLPALKGSVFRDFKEIMQDKFRIWDNRSMNKSEMIYTLPNGSFVEFFSTDDEQKIRGRKRNVLYCNEANEISYLEWQQLVMRTTQFSIVDYNPSFTDEHWLCGLNKDPRTYHFISTYKDNPFLEQTIIDEIESLQHKNKTLWTVYGLGQQAMAEGIIFPKFDIVDEFPMFADRVAAGLDFGYAQDPTAIVRCGIVDNNLYLDEQCYRTHMLANEIIRELKRIGLHVYADSADPRLIQEIANAGIVIYPADKYKGSIMGGLTKMMEYRLCVTKRSVNLIKELRNYVYDQDKDGRLINEPIDAYNHCFTGETMIETLCGSKRIDTISVGDYVLTSNGYQRVSKFFDNGCRKILHIKIFFRNFVVEIKATPEHKFKTTRGWKQLKDLTRTDVLYTCKSLMGKSIVYTMENGISLVEQNGFTEKCGNPIMGTYQKAITSITKIKIHGIMKSAILNLSKVIPMSRCTQMNKLKKRALMILKSAWAMQGHLRTSGMELMKAKNGIVNTLKSSEKICSPKYIRVCGVEKNFSLFHSETTSFVQTSVKQHLDTIQELTTKHENANGVERNLSQTNIAAQSSVAEVVAENMLQASEIKKIEIVSEEVANVYDLEVENMHEFFANGVLVHNCIDGIRYYVLGKILGRILKPKDYSGIFGH